MPLSVRVSTLMRVTVSQATPAGRLHRLLSEIRQQPPNQNIVQAWAEVLGIPANRRAELYRTYSFVVALPDEIAAEVEKVDQERYNTALAMRWHDKITRAFEVDFSGAYRSRISPIGTTGRRWPTLSGAMTCYAAGCQAVPCSNRAIWSGSLP